MNYTLQPGNRINDYEIQDILGAGGFGVTYQAMDLNLRHEVAIKEYFPTIAIRSKGSRTVRTTEINQQEYAIGLDRFYKEAQLLAQFSHINIVRILNAFEGNGTAYMVMEYEHGQDLSKFIEKIGRPLCYGEIIGFFVPILDGLRAMHKKNVLHLDLKPNNILIRTNSTPCLIDFGGARYQAAQASRLVTAKVSFMVATDGYSPPEQYSNDKESKGAWSDIYALGATLYACMDSGKIPPSSTMRSGKIMNTDRDPLQPATERFKGKYPQALLELVDRCLSLQRSRRPQNAQDMQDILIQIANQETIQSKGHEEQSVDSGSRSTGSTSKPQNPRSGFWLRAAAFLLLLLALVALLVVARAAHAVEKPAIFLQPAGLEGNSLTLQWWVEGLRGQTVTRAELLVDGATVNARSQLEPARGQAVCYLLMVDTSKSMVTKSAKGLTSTNSEIIGLLKAIVEGKPAHHALGLMSFSKQATILVEPTQDKTALLQALTDIKFDQSRTELFRFVENGVRSLEQCPPAYRKVVLLVSDGLAEDQSFNKEEASQFARQRQVSLYSFLVKDTDSLQNLVYLAEKTGGWGSEPADHGPSNRAKTIASLYQDSNSGGNLQAVLPQGRPIQGVQLRITLSNGERLAADVPLRFASLNPAPSNSVPSPVLPEWKKKLLAWVPGLTPNQLDYISWGLGGLLLLLLGGLAYRVLRPRLAPPKKSRDPIGFLVGHEQSYPIFAGVNSIGFLPTNDIVIDDDTVGRTHATLHYQGDGDVVLTDLNSLNGCWVNGNRIQRPTCIQDGDLIALGEWRASFQRVR